MILLSYFSLLALSRWPGLNPCLSASLTDEQGCWAMPKFWVAESFWWYIKIADVSAVCLAAQRVRNQTHTPSIISKTVGRPSLSYLGCVLGAFASFMEFIEPLILDRKESKGARWCPDWYICTMCGVRLQQALARLMVSPSWRFQASARNATAFCPPLADLGSQNSWRRVIWLGLTHRCQL